MIRLENLEKPTQMTDEWVAKKTEIFKKDKKSVWKEDFIRNWLFVMSHRKCCFSECKLVEEGKYMEVEHFNPKSLYPDEVVNWLNLLPISGACNKAKGDHDTKLSPILNPRFHNPQEHLYFKNYLLRGKTTLGTNTIKVLNLNDRENWLNRRLEIVDKIQKDMNETFKIMEHFTIRQFQDEDFKQMITRKLNGLLKESTSKYEYSAITATTVLNHFHYQPIKSAFIIWNLWTQELEDLETQAMHCTLDIEMTR